MKLSASQAAKKTGKSVPTITRAIKSGKISAEKTKSGGYQIEASELFRVFNAVTEEPNAKGNSLGDETPPKDAKNAAEASLLQEKIDALETALADAKAERDEWRDQAKRLALALPSPQASTDTNLGRPWWKRWLAVG
ncbi:hypothetical protein [Pseudooceanicola sp. HF7]|uniref:hypothetical protein n=1 Tax=Pseudooceanicola sp. HF7 TaxID=2721560 RepID=UPI00142F762F|nr:hypothetical protein [Pseudooceanicola sp. HF7]NIZ11749.1 hypothetical protein [Pseudooceanicola sp. HF7]